jgi:hypothetical protein
LDVSADEGPGCLADAKDQLVEEFDDEIDHVI